MCGYKSRAPSRWGWFSSPRLKIQLVDPVGVTGGDRALLVTSWLILCVPQVGTGHSWYKVLAPGLRLVFLSTTEKNAPCVSGRGVLGLLCIFLVIVECWQLLEK